MKTKTPLKRRAWFEFLSSMRFAVALLTLLAVASVIGTVLQQNQPMSDYVIKFGPFWFEIFKTLGLFDVYAAPWFVLILIFLVLSISLCLWRHTPTFWRQMRSFREQASRQSLAAMKHSVVLTGRLEPSVVQRYLQVQGYQVKTKPQADGSVLVAAKKGSASKLGYVFAHAAIVLICIGGLIDSHVALSWGRLTGAIVPDNQTQLAQDFAANARMNPDSLSFRGNVTIAQGQSTDVVFLNAGDGLVVQELPFAVTLKRFHVDYYDTGMPKNFASDVLVTDKTTGEVQAATIKVNQPLMVNGIALFQSSFGDGGSSLHFNAWNVRQPVLEAAPMQATSMTALPLQLDGKAYRLELDELRVLNVEEQTSTLNSSVLNKPLQEVRDVNQAAQLRNVGPTITYSVRDETGVAYEYLAYMLPQQRDDGLYFLLGERAAVNADFRWVALPADANGELTTFMLLRQGLADAAVRERATVAALAQMDDATRAQFQVWLEPILALFAHGGYAAFDALVEQEVVAAEQARMRTFLLDVLQAGSGHVLDEVLHSKGLAKWGNTPERARFIADASLGMSALQSLQAPLYLQLTDFQQVQASGLQVVKSPGRYWVYFGSLLLILGTVCMFYVREMRLWVWVDANSLRVAMSATRPSRDLGEQFAAHQMRLQRLQQDLM